MAQLSLPSLLLLAIGSAPCVPSTPAQAAIASPSPVDRWAGFISEASHRFGIPEEWIRRVMRAESGGRTALRGRPIVSVAGAMGLMQLMPGTWAEMRAAHGLGPDPHAPRDNIMAGTAYLRLMYDRFGYPGLFGAYNAGPQRYAQYLERRRRLPGETVAYMAVVTAGSPGREAPIRPPASPALPATPAALFAPLSGSPAEGRADLPAAPPEPPSLFIPLQTVRGRISPAAGGPR